jgi:hypothetical protein
VFRNPANPTTKCGQAARETGIIRIHIRIEQQAVRCLRARVQAFHHTDIEMSRIVSVSRAGSFSQ